MSNKGSLLPSHPHGARIAEIFSYGWRWLEAPNDGLKTEWKTNSKYCIRPRILWQKYQDANTIVGVRFGSTTRYALVDVDKDSPHNSPEGIQKLCWALETMGIARPIVIRSSWSGGHHIYCPLPGPVNTFGLAVALEQTFLAHGYPLSPGHLETFPNVKAYAKWWEGEYSEYNGHRLPLQPATGSCIVDPFDLEPIPQGESLAIFLATWENRQQHTDMDMLLEAISTAKAHRRRRQRMAKTKVAEWQADLEATIAEGWTGPHQTNHLLKEIACYGRVFRGLSGAALVDYIERTATNAPGFFEHSDHQADLNRRAHHWAVSASHYYWPLGSLPTIERTNLTPNDYRAREARERIQDAIQQLGDVIGLTVRQLATKLASLAGCSMATLYRNRDLWHPFGIDVTPAAPEPAPETPLEQSPVTADIPMDAASIEELRAIVRASLESVELSAVTGRGGGNEVCSLKSLLQKNLKSGQGEGGPGGRGVFPQPAPVENSSDWFPRLDWKEGAVGDV